MTITSPIPYFMIMLFYLIAGNFISRHTEFYRQVIESSSTAKYKTLDGLRGLLSLSVFFHHAMFNYYYFQTDKWDDPPSRFYIFLGQAAVAIFFMITGFLFWSKAIKEKRFNLKNFYTSRFLRIYPMHWFVCLIVIILAIAASRFSIRESNMEIFLEISSWLTCGFFGFPFIHELPSINKVDTTMLSAAVQWTLIYEIKFYLVLPILVLLIKPYKFLLFAISILALNMFFQLKDLSTMINFMLGMSVPYIISIIERYKLKKIFLDEKTSLIIILIPIVIIITTPPEYHYRLFSLISLYVGFIAIVLGNDVLGLLTRISSRFLGIISYSIYLLHGIVLYVALNLVNYACPIKNMSALVFWSIIAFCGLIVIVLSAITYRFIEYPFLRKHLS